MASSSQAANCNGGDIAFEETLWTWKLQFEMEVARNLLLQADEVVGTQTTEERVIMAAKECASMRKVVIKNITSMKDYPTRFMGGDFEISNAALKWLEGQQATSMRNNLLTCLFLSNLLVFDKQRNWESRFLKLFWRHSNGISDANLLLFLSKLAEHYSPSHEVDNLERFMLTNEERATFLNDCSTFDEATCLAKDFNEFSLVCICQGQKPQDWTQRDHTLHSMSSFSELVKPLELIFPISTRFETAKECLDRLDLLKSVTVDLNPDESDTLASLLSSFKSHELQALHALKKEMELHGELALQLEQLSGKHLRAYKDQLERSDEFFHTCQEEKRNVFQEALYKKVKCLTSIKKANVNRQVKLSSEDLLKWIVQKAETACKEVEDKLKKAQSSENVDSKECTLCYLEFSKKRKRACLDPCGHASACIDCATKAWSKKPCCPWCKVSIRKPTSIPAQIFL